MARTHYNTSGLHSSVGRQYVKGEPARIPVTTVAKWARRDWLAGKPGGQCHHCKVNYAQTFLKPMVIDTFGHEEFICGLCRSEHKGKWVDGKK